MFKKVKFSNVSWRCCRISLAAEYSSPNPAKLRTYVASRLRKIKNMVVHNGLYLFNTFSWLDDTTIIIIIISIIIFNIC